MVHGKLNMVNFGINDHTILSTSSKQPVFKEELEQDQVDNLVDTLSPPSEVAMKLWSVLGNGEINNTIKLHQSQVDGESVLSWSRSSPAIPTPQLRRLTMSMT